MKTDKESRLEELQSHAEDTDKRIAELKAEIEAEKKPKLRHGQVIKSEYCDPVVVIKDGGLFKTYSKYGFCPQRVNGVSSYGVICEDIFADFAAMQEDVTEFEMTDGHGDLLSVTMNAGSRLRIVVTQGVKRCIVNFSLPQAEELSLKLKQWIATAKRNEAKE